MAPDEPAKTVRKKNKIVHYSLDRYLTALEYKRLMSFPDNHVICGTQSEVRDQIGNAVLCKFAEAIGKTIMASYRQGECMVDLLPSSTA
jgi:DNA (cytosine-5)-methyltransferase 1